MLRSARNSTRRSPPASARTTGWWRSADRAGRCHRELPIIWQAPDGTLIEGTIDLAFEDAGGSNTGRSAEGPEPRLTVLDFKTDRELDADIERYRRQLAIYCRALSALRGQPAQGILMRI